MKIFEKTEYSNRGLNLYQIQGKPQGLISNNSILEAYDNLPQSMQKELKNIYVFDSILKNNKGQLILGQADNTKNTIYLYKSNNLVQAYQKHVIPHEVGRLLYKNIDVSAYRIAMNSDSTLNTLRNKPTIPSRYAAQKGIKEDFPESIRLALRNIDKFKNDFPYKYEYIKQFLS